MPFGTSDSQLKIVIDAENRSKQALKEVEEGLNRTKKNMKSVSSSMKEMGDKMVGVGKQLSMKVTAPIMAIGAVAAKSAADFEAAMTKSLAIMNVTVEQEKEMERVAREVAKSTTFSHKEAADSYFYLASAGLGANEAIASLPKVAQFAEAGAFDMALATDLLTDAQSALGMTIRDDAVANMENMVKVSDTLVKANTLANATVQQFSESLTTEAGAAMKSFGMDIEEGVAVLAAFADQGVKGQVAGSGLSRVLRLLTQAANSNKKEMKALGIEVYDSEGNLRNMADIIANLEVALEGMSDAERTAALESIGFSARIQGIILPLLGTSEAIRQYEKDLRDASGITEDVATKQLETFNAQMKIIKDQMIDVAITIGDILIPHIKKFAEWIKNIVSRFQELSPETQKTIILIAGIAAAIGPLLIVLGVLVKAIVSVIAIFTFLTSAAGLVVLAIASLIAIGWFLYNNWEQIFNELKFRWKQFSEIVSKIVGKINETIKGWIDTASMNIRNGWNGVKEFFENLWEYIVGVFSSAYEDILGLVDKITGLANRAKEAIQSIPSRVGGFVSSGFESAKGYLGFQHGGVVPGPIGAPVPAIVHGGETVIPHGKQGGITVNITGNTFMSDDEAAEAIGDRIVNILKTQNRFIY